MRPPEPRPLISVVVCTRNRAELLRGVLAGLARQSLPASDYEVLVVDNGSTDHTADVVADLAPRLPSLRFLREEATGLSHARNRGFREARGEWVAYTDDDCRIPPQWLAEARRAIEERRPEILGGPVYPFYEEPKPLWYLDAYGGRERGHDARPLAPEELLIGCNLLVRREALERVGGFPPDLGMAGTRVAYGEEAAVQWRVRRDVPHAVAYYAPEVFVFHLVRGEQMRWPWLVRSFFGKGRDVWLSSPAGRESGRAVPSRPALALDLAKTAAALALDVAVGPWLRSRERHPRVGNYLFEHSSQYVRRLGRLWAQLRGSRRPAAGGTLPG